MKNTTALSLKVIDNFIESIDNKVVHFNIFLKTRRKHRQTNVGLVCPYLFGGFFISLGGEDHKFFIISDFERFIFF